MDLFNAIKKHYNNHKKLQEERKAKERQRREERRKKDKEEAAKRAKFYAETKMCHNCRYHSIGWEYRTGSAPPSFDTYTYKATLYFCNEHTPKVEVESETCICEKFKWKARSIGSTNRHIINFQQSPTEENNEPIIDNRFE